MQFFCLQYYILRRYLLVCRGDDAKIHAHTFPFFVQACRNGLVQHLENLLFYGADMNAKNASGNTPLHVCAVDNQEACARLLLFRGADKEALNFANQTPYQVAVIAGNLDLASLIHRFKDEDVGESSARL